MPFFFSQSMALSMSPAHALRAFFESRMPAPERPRSSLTMTAVMGGPSTAGASLGFSSALGFASSLGSSLGFSSLGFSASSAPDLYLASSFSTPAAKSSSFFSRPSPRFSLTKRRITRFSPSFAMRSFSTSSTVFSSSLSHFCFMRDISSYFFLRRPTTIFSLMFSGFPSRSSLAISSAFSLLLTSSGTSSDVTQTMLGFAAICMATSLANSLKMALLATKSVSLFTSTITASFELKCT
mmetsp:Transcript_16343/g.47865  ORF Transcript_16343/g.47865 Transcript_16343/m.47865 type:complete len:239 (-) Transcript_16343:1006-1722(-)